jgi:hypothetical protein
MLAAQIHSGAVLLPSCRSLLAAPSLGCGIAHPFKESKPSSLQMIIWPPAGNGVEVFLSDAPLSGIC